MERSETVAHPYGAKGIDCGDFAVEFGTDKVFFFNNSIGEHYTIHRGDRSGILDIRRTWKDGSGEEKHQTVFAMHHEDLAAFLAELTSLPTELFRLIRHLRLGWLLKRRDIGIVWGLEPITNEHIAVVTHMKSRKKRLVIEEEKWCSRIYEPEYLDEVLAHISILIST